MRCDVSVLKDMRSELVSAAKEAKELEGEMSSSGESFALSAAFFEDLARNVKDPQRMINRFQERIESLSKPFHIELRRVLGEELTVTEKNSEQKYYILGSAVSQKAGTEGTVQVVMRMAPSNAIHDAKTFVFNLNSDTAVETVGTTAGTVTGITPILRKAVLNAAQKAINSRRPEGKIDAHGDSSLHKTLTKMRSVDNILGMRQDRNGESLKGYELVPDYKHGDIDSMKEILGKLHVLGNSKAPESLIQYYTSLLDKMHPRFFNHVDLWLKKNQADTFGEIDLDKNTLHISLAKRTSKVHFSEAEVYMHEVIHSITSWAFRQQAINIGGIRTALNQAMDVAKQHIKWQDFLPLDEEQATERQKEQATALMEYIFTSKNSAEEFMAYALTNPVLLKRLQEIKLSDKKVKEPKTVFEKISSLFIKMLNITLGKFGFKDNDITVFDEVNKLVFRLAEINNKAAHDLKNMNHIGKMMEVLEDSESFLSKKIYRFLSRFKADDFIDIPTERNLYQTAKLFLTMAVKGISNKTYRGALGLLASAVRITPDSSIREFVSGLFDKDTAFRVAERLGLLMSSVDTSRNSVINANSKQISEAFKTPATEEEEIALTRILLDTNLTSLKYNRTGSKKEANKHIVSLLTDDEFLKTRIGRVKHEIKTLLSKTPERASWTTEQATSLGYFMATGIGHEALNLNADNIVKGFGTNERFKYDKKLKTLVDEVATLTAVKYSNKEQKQLVARVINEEQKAFNLITDMYEGYKRTSSEALFKGNSHHMVAGHSKELFDDSIDIQIAPVADRASMEMKGYKFRYELKTGKGVKQAEPMAVYTTNTWGKAERLRGAVALGKLHTRGTTLSNIKMKENPVLGAALFQRDFASVYNTSTSIHEAMKAGTFDVEKFSHGMVPVYAETGVITDYRYMMDKNTKEKLLGQDLRISQVLPRSIASIDYQIKTDEINKQSLTAIQEDMRNNWKDGDIGIDGFTEYTLIGPSVDNQKGRDLYLLLPDSYRAFILSRADKTMAVRTDLLRVYFGGQHLRTTDLPGLNLLPGVIKSLINVMEGLWMELIKISKGAILIKMPMVLVHNLISNVVLQINQGAVNIPQLAKDYKESIKEVNEYIVYNRKAIRLEQEIRQDKEALRRVGNGKALQNIIKEKTVELGRLRSALSANPAAELFELGYFQSHTEDLENSALNETNKISKAVNNRMEKLPAVVRSTAEVAYLTQNTTWYKVSQEILQRSDMIARLVDSKQKIRTEIKQANGDRRLPQWWLDIKRDGYKDRQELTGEERKEFLRLAKEVRLQTILDNYVNYTLPNGNFEEYLNRLGLLMFFKYYKRIQTVVTETTLSNPIKSTLLNLLAVAGVPIETLQDQALLSRMYDNNGEFSLLEAIPFTNPIFHIQNVTTPALIKDAHLGGLF